MKLTLGFSPCPNDTFIFDGMIHNKIDTEGLEFEVVMEDVEALNKMAFQGKLDITKLSYHAYAYLIDKYVLLNAGSALGNNCGPLLISKNTYSQKEVDQLSIVIPGKYTTANFLLSLAFPAATNKKAVLFSEIEPMVIHESAQAGLIIHENRFTYQEKGLRKIIDLGEFWEQKTKLPIPLGGIVVDRNQPLEIQQKVNRVMRRSVEYALNNPTATKDFVRQHAQEMEEEVMFKHIKLYVNDYTVDLGEKGREAVQTLFDIAWKQAIIPASNLPLFIAEGNGI